MIELNDDLLNRYIDSELDNELMREVKRKLESSPQEMKKYKQLLAIHNKLKKMPADEVSDNFTTSLMLKVQRSLKSKKEQNFFIVSVLSLFILICIGIIGYLLSYYFFTSGTNSTAQFNVEHLVTFISSLFSKGNISIIGSVFSFILLISGYFFYDNLKHSR